MDQRLSDLTAQIKAQAAGRLAGRWLQTLAAQVKGNPDAAHALLNRSNWVESGTIKAAISGMATTDSTAVTPTNVGDDFLLALRSYSIPARLQSLRRVPLNVRVFSESSRTAGYETAEGAPTPVSRGTWAATQLTPRKFQALSVVTNELVASMSAVAAQGLTSDLAGAVGGIVNKSFLHPLIANSATYGQTSITSSGTTLTAITADLRALCAAVPGAWNSGVFCMSPTTAAYLATLLDGAGALAFPTLGPAGGELLAMPAFVSDSLSDSGSPTQRYIALLSPSEIFFADDRPAELALSDQTALQLLDNPTNSTATPTATNLVSMYQTGSTALRATAWASWLARSGSAAYLITSY